MMRAASAKTPPTTEPAIIPARAPDERPLLFELEPELFGLELAEVIVEGARVEVKVEVPTTMTVELTDIASAIPVRQKR